MGNAHSAQANGKEGETTGSSSATASDSDAGAQPAPPFDRPGAQRALQRKSRTARFMCRNRKGPKAFTATVTFGPGGSATKVRVEPTRSVSPAKSCVRSSFRTVRIHPFDGEPQTLSVGVILD